MIKINLIAKKNKFHMPTVLGINLNDVNIIGLAIAIVFFYLPDVFLVDFFKKEQEVQNASIAEKRAQLTKLQAKGSEGLKSQLEAYHKKAEELSHREKYVNEILDFRVNPYKVLLTIAKNIPQKLWFTSLDIQQDTTVVIKGETYNYTDIGELITKLNETAFFRQSLQIPSDASAIQSDKERRIERFEIRGQVVSFDPWKQN